MDRLSDYAERPIAFLLRYVRRRVLAHAAILGAVIGAVGCSVSSQYGVKFLVDTLSAGPHGTAVWLAFAVLVSLIAADNLLWRLAGWIASHAFVGVTGDLRSELFRHLTGHAPSYFTQRLSGTLTGRVTATSNAAFAVENLFIWNVLPPCVATVGAIAFLAVVSIPLAAALTAISALIMLLLFRLAAAGAPLHHGFASRAARVEGELADVIGNMPLVRTFGAIGREHSRFDQTVGLEMQARRKSLLYLERLRLLHAALTIVLTVAVLAWAIVLWQHGRASAGDVVLVLHAGASPCCTPRATAWPLMSTSTWHAGGGDRHPVRQPVWPCANIYGAPLEPRRKGVIEDVPRPTRQPPRWKTSASQLPLASGLGSVGRLVREASTRWALLQRSDYVPLDASTTPRTSCNAQAVAPRDPPRRGNSAALLELENPRRLWR